MNQDLTTANHIRTLRAYRRMSQAELAKRSGLSQGDISRIETGRLNPTEDEVTRIRQALNWSPELDMHLEALA